MTAAEMSAKVLVRIDDSATSPGSVAADSQGLPVPPEVLSALNEAQELFCLLSLCLEVTAPLTLTASTTFATLRGTFPDFLVPLKLTVAGVRVRPATLRDLDAFNTDWQNTAGAPRKYFTAGFSFYGVTPQPVNDTTASLTYARSPLQMVGDAFPEIREQHHPALVSYSVYRLKLKEGGQGLERGMKYFNEFLDAAQAEGDFVRAKSRAAALDTLPIEMKLADRARLFPKTTKEKTPWSKPSV